MQHNCAIFICSMTSSAVVKRGGDRGVVGLLKESRACEVDAIPNQQKQANEVGYPQAAQLPL